MTASDSVRRQRRTTELSVALLALAAVALAIAFSAVGQEVLTLPDRRQEAAEIAARLPGLQAERNALLDEVAAHKAELSSLRTKVEEARDIAGRLPDLRAEETRARAERDRLTREVAALAADRDTLRGTVDQLAERRRSFEDEHHNLVARTEAERKRLDEVRQAVGDRRTTLTQIGDEHAAQGQKLAQLMTDLADTDRLLESKRTVLKGLTVEEQDLRTRVARLQEEGEKLEIGNQRAAEQSATLREELAEARTTLTTIQGQRDQARDELARARTMRDVEHAYLETVAVRLQHLTSLEARVRQQLRAIIEDLSAVEQASAGSEPSR